MMNIFMKGLKKPHKVFKHLINWLQLTKIRVSPFVASYFIHELYNRRKFWDHIHNTIDTVKTFYRDPRLGGWMLGYPAIALYALVRLTKPKVVIETGVGPGGSSALILLALEANGKGHLYSIDLPGNDAVVYPSIGKCYNIHVPPGYDVGWLVPAWLRERWSLYLGDSRELLPKLSAELGSVDIFLHDSLHTDEHVLFELSTIFPYLETGGLLLADDVNEYWSTAFIRFCNGKQLPFVILGQRLGIARKV